MANQVYMNVPAVRDISKNFQNICELLEDVAKVLDMLSNLLKNTAFIGLVGGAVVIQVLEMIKPQIQEMSRKCGELSKDLGDSVDAFERGDEIGATRFH